MSIEPTGEISSWPSSYSFSNTASRYANFFLLISPLLIRCQNLSSACKACCISCQCASMYLHVSTSVGNEVFDAIATCEVG